MRVIIILFLVGFTINAQNLVPNPSFENYILCPTSMHQIDHVASWHNVSDHTATPDFFHGCSLFDVCTVPTNNLGTQAAFEGNGYVGIITYSLWSLYREYIQAQLTSPLTAGQIYYISFYVSCAENGRYGSNKIGAKLTSNPINGSGTPEPLYFNPNVWSDQVISNTTEWTLVSGSYLASGGEQYITIGNFSNDAGTQVVVTNPNATAISNFAYYYIDQVIVSTSQMGNSQFQVVKAVVTPNPVIDEFSVNVDGSEEISQIELYNQYGKVRTFNNITDRFNIKELPSGIYYLMVTYASKKRVSTKIVKL